MLAALLVALTGSLRLIAPPAPACPDEAAVSEALSRLGDRDLELDATAEWVPAADGMELVIRSATVAMRRVLPQAPCAQLADMVALAIDRFTSPLESPGGLRTTTDPEPSPLRAEAAAPPEPTPPRFGVEAGVRIDVPGPAIDVELGGAWWLASAWALLLLVDVPATSTDLETRPPGSTGPTAVGSLHRADVALGARWRPIESGPLSAGLSALADLEVDWNTALPIAGGMIASNVSPRPVLRTDAWAGATFGRLELRLTAGGRLGPSTVFHAQPLSDLASLSAVDAHIALSLGLRLGGEPR
jgi:hypothetical protein